MPRPSALAASLLTALLLAATVPAQAQVRRLPTRRIVSRPWGAPTPAVSGTTAVSAGAAAATSGASATVPTSDARAAAAPVVAQTSEATVPVPPAAPVSAAPTGGVETYGRTGLRVTLPAGWAGAGAADESRLPAYALYTFTNTAGGALAGVTLRVEQVTGLNPAEEQGWRTGQARVGYHGQRPVGPAQVPLEALVAVETAGQGSGGATAFVQRGRTFWAVSVQAPAATWAARRAAVVGLMAGVSIPAASPAATGTPVTPTSRRR